MEKHYALEIKAGNALLIIVFFMYALGHPDYRETAINELKSSRTVADAKKVYEKYKSSLSGDLYFMEVVNEKMNP